MKNFIVFLLGAAALCGACQPSSEASLEPSDVLEGQPEAEAQERLVTLGGPITEITCALGHCEQVVGADASSTWPQSVTALPRLPYYRKLSAESVLALRPTRVLAAQDAGPPEVLEQLRGAGVQVDLIAGGDSVDSARQRILALGRLLEKPQEAAALVASVDRDLQKLEQARETTGSRPRVLFLYARGARTLLVSGGGTGAHAMIELAGGQNALQEVEGFKPLTAEAALGANPEIIVVPEAGLHSLGGPGALWELPGLANTAAHKNEAVVTVDDQKLLGFGPRLGQAALELHRKLKEAAP